MATSDQSPATSSPIGRDTLRIDGPRKVTGLAKYASDFHFPGMLYAVPVEATIANGKLLTLDTAAAEKMPGVRAVLHRGQHRQDLPLTLPRLVSIASALNGDRRSKMTRSVTGGNTSLWPVADTFESAKAAADAVRATYSKEKPQRRAPPGSRQRS